MNVSKCQRSLNYFSADKFSSLLFMLVVGFFCGSAALFAQKDTTNPDRPGPDTKKFKIRNLGFTVNTEDLEYAPTVTADGKTLYFVSERPGGIGGHDFWVTTKKERLDTVCSKPKNLGRPVNTEMNEGVASIAADGQTIYFTGCERPDGLGDCDIYEAELDGDEWKNIRNVLEINSPYWDSQPSISSDGKTMFFNSNRPGAMGGDGDADIYVTTKGSDGKWSKPKNLGPPINTSEREDSPFILAGGKALYFASAGHGGFGGLDFFVVFKQADGSWGTPENLGEPVNTKQDERFITLPASGDIIYFSSQRTDLPNAGKLDIFEGKLLVNLLVTGRVYDKCTQANLPANITFINMTTGDTVYRADISSATGTYSFTMPGGPGTTLRAVGTTPGYPPIDEKFDIPSTMKYIEVKHDFPVGATPVLGATVPPSDFSKNLPAGSPAKYRDFRGLLVEEIKVTELYPLLTYVFFDSGSATIPSRYVLFDNPDQTNAFDDEKIPGGTLEKYRHVLNVVGYRMRKHPETKIKIVGCNSKQPTINEVKSVSEVRGKVVYDYLINIWKIDAGRIQLLSARDLPERPSNIRDPLGIVENRRTEIQVDDPANRGWEIVKPIVQVDNRLLPQPDTMHFQMKNGISDALVARRTIEIKRNGKMWNTLTKIGITDPVSPAWDWKNSNDDDITKDEDTFTAQLVLYSHDGKECRSNEVPIPAMYVSQELKRRERLKERTIDRFSLVLFKFDSPEAGPLNERIMKEYIYTTVDKGSKIEVTGYTDVVGLDDRNMKLSNDRAMTVKNGVAKNKAGVYQSMNAKGVGETSPLYDNALPEGRFYNRTVQVIIDTPREASSNP